MKRGQNVVVTSGKFKGTRGKFITKTFVKFTNGSGTNRVLIETEAKEKVWLNAAMLSTNYYDFQLIPRKGELPVYLDAGFKITKLPPAQGQYY